MRPVGKRLDHYLVARRIGVGGMGEVYRAIDERLGRDVAIKLLPAASADARDRQMRLIREAQAASHLNHPGIVTIHDVGSWQKRTYVVMELVEGQRLSRVIKRGVTVREAVGLCRQMAEALAAAHERGILHRDIKPDNVMVRPDGRVKVLDFGLAKLHEPGQGPPSSPGTVAPASESQLEAIEMVSTMVTPVERSAAEAIALALEDTDPSSALDHTLYQDSGSSHPMATGSDELVTVAGSLLGTPAYMSPEQAAGAEVDVRSEVYSLALVLYELLSQKRPLEREELEQTLAAARASDIAPIGDACARRIPRRLERLLEQALAREPDRRPPSMSAFIDQLTAIERQLALGSRTRWWMAAGAILVAVGAGALIAWSMQRGDDSDDQRAAQAVVSSSKRLTFDPGCEEMPAFSADGRYVYFDGEVDGDYEIQRIDLESGQRTRLTKREGWDIYGRPSPDGDWFAYVHYGEQARELWIASPGPAGEPRLVLAPVRGLPRWMPWGELVIGGNDGRIRALSIGEDGQVTSTRIIDQVPVGIVPLLYAPLSERRILFGGRPAGATEGMLSLGIVDRHGHVTMIGDAVLASDRAGLASDAAGNGFYMSSPTSAGTERVHWRSLIDGTAVVQPAIPQVLAGMDISSDRTRLVLSSCRQTSRVHLVDADGRYVELRETRDWDDAYPSLVDDQHILVTSNRSDTDQIWLQGPGDASRLVVEGSSEQGRASQAGDRLAWVSKVDGERGLWTRPLAGDDPPVRLTSDPDDRWPAFAASDRQLFFLRTVDGGSQVHRIELDARGQPVGQAEPVTPVGVGFFAVSPGPTPRVAWIAAADRNAIRLGPPGGPFETLAAPPGDHGALAFSADGARLSVIRGLRELIVIDLEQGGKGALLWSSGNDALSQVAAGPGGGWLVQVAAYKGDLTLLEGHFP